MWRQRTRALPLLGLALCVGACRDQVPGLAPAEGLCAPLGMPVGASARACAPGEVCGSTGCRACLADGECASGERCCAGACAAVAQCDACTADVQCGPGRRCCGERCVEGECCSAADCSGRACRAGRCAPSAVRSEGAVPPGCSRSADCPEGTVCVAGACGACGADSDCGSGARCCAGRCSAGDCCADPDCGAGGRCESHSCARCSSDGDCSADERCCGGACLPGDCCTSAECAGRVCRQHVCQPCARDEQCSGGEVCCGGLCAAGDCCERADCEPGQVCRERRCAACARDVDCGPGEQCCGGSCRVGGCEATPARVGEGPLAPPLMSCADGSCVARVAASVLVSCADDSTCGPGGKCCGNTCVAGDCCGSEDCPIGLDCLQYACQACQVDAQCGAGRVCCSGACSAGTCCPGEACPSGGVCAGGACAVCAKDSDCGGLGRCCGGRCSAGDCCSRGDCGRYACRDGWCSACVSDDECGADARCCNGACAPGAQCCSRDECPAGQLCRSGRCVSCAKDDECGFGQRCCGGVCNFGTCCRTADCTGGSVCNPSHVCGPCSDDAQCGAGQRCCGGACVDGTCCAASDCAAGKLCINHACGSCSTQADCEVGEVCCGPAGARSCRQGTCCSNADCGGADGGPGVACLGGVCAPCETDQQCDPSGSGGAKCCGGACYPGRQCCSNTDCSGNYACVSGRCQPCSSNAECDGLMCCADAQGIGRCQVFCEVSQSWTGYPTFRLGTGFEGVSIDGGTGAGADGGSGGGGTGSWTCPADTICWAGGRETPGMPYLWVPATGEGAVYRYNTDTGARAGPFLVGVKSGWPAATAKGAARGDSPSRTSVNQQDDTVWVANRCPSGSPTNPACSGVAHLDASGNMLCYAAVPDVARAAAVDLDGNVWIGSYSGRKMYRLSGSELDPAYPAADPPVCKRLAVVSVPGNPYGAAADAHGRVWIQGGGKIIAIDARTGAVVKQKGLGAYGITVDESAVWLSRCGSVAVNGATYGGVCRLDMETLAVTQYPLPSISGIATAGEYVYSGSWPGSYGPTGSPHLGRLRKSDGAICEIPLLGGKGWTIAAAVDSAGRAWGVDYHGPLTRVDAPGGQGQACAPAGQSVLFVVQDISGSMRDPAKPGSPKSKWATAQEAVPALVARYSDRLKFGALFFPSDAYCAVNSPVGRYALSVPATQSQVQTLYSGTAVGGATPAHDALDAARVLLQSVQVAGSASKNVLLITDGMPNCRNGVVDRPEPKAIRDTVAAAGRLRVAGVKVYVLGFGASLYSDKATLDEIAANGGTVQAYVADDEASLNAAMDAIATASSGCCLPSAQVSFPGSTAGQYVYTDITGQQLAQVQLDPGVWRTVYDSGYARPGWYALDLAAVTPGTARATVRVRSADTVDGLMNAEWSPAASAFPMSLTQVPRWRFLEVEITLVAARRDQPPYVTSLKVTWKP